MVPACQARWHSLVHEFYIQSLTVMLVINKDVHSGME